MDVSRSLTSEFRQADRATKCWTLHVTVHVLCDVVSDFEEFVADSTTEVGQVFMLLSAVA